MRKIYIYTTLLLFFLLATRSNAFSQIVTVGSGSYTTQLPPPDAAGRNVDPTGIPRISGNALNKPVATSDWWTGLLTFDNANLYNYPLSMRAMTNGLVVSYTTPGSGPDDTRQPMSADQPVLVGVSGLSVTNPTVSDYSDWTVTASWDDGTHHLSAIMGMGMPFVYFTKGASDVASVTITIGSVSVQHEMILVTNSEGGKNFAVYAPTGSTWTQSGNTYTSTLSGKNYFSVAMLPDGADAATAASDFKNYAYVFPGNTTVTWSYNNNTSTVQSTFTVTPDVKEGSGTSVIMGLLPHQWAHLSASSPQPGSYVYATVRGTMKLLASNRFTVENKFSGILSMAPTMAKYSPTFDPSALVSKIDQMKGDGLQTWTDSYNDGLAMNRLVQAARIADQMGDTAARNEMINTVKGRLENWFKADPGENAFLFYYNNTWNTLIGYPAGYYSDANINDHHFHYGYFINAATAVEQFDPGWAAQWGGMVDMLVKDAANWDKNDPRFPFLRNFNPYAGHSFASGELNNEPHGNNQESSSEAMNFNAGLIQWGAMTGDTAIRNLGIYLYTTEASAIDEYWFSIHNRNFASTYAHPMCARVWGDGYDRGTFWTNDIAAMYGIEMFPLTGASLYLGHDTAYVSKLWNDMTTQTGVLQDTPNDNLWYDVYWEYLAFEDPSTALSLYNNYPSRSIKNGESDANTYNWLHSFDGAGHFDASVTADYPIAAVFDKSGKKTYIAHNYGSAPITVSYSDGYSMTVPARTLKSSKDIDAKATLSVSATQIPTGGTISLTANITGSVTKVEFYDGTTLLGTKTAAPWTYTTPALPAGKPGFYVRIYNGSYYNLSNVVRAYVGAQLPYGGTPWAIPGTIEAGNYDYFEGGVGQDVSYFDTDVANQAGSFRAPEYVDAGPTTNEGNTVGWINDGEWLEYSVNIANSGTYDLGIRYASGNTDGGGPFHIEVDGTTIANNITLGFTSSDWSVWATKTVSSVSLPAGQHVIRYYFDKGGFNLGRTTFTYTGSNISVTGVSLSPATASLTTGGTLQLSAAVSPANATDKIVSWSSDNTSVATVDANGLVTAVSPGNTNITVTTQDGSKTASAAVTVTSTNVAVTGVSLSPASVSLTTGATQQLTATVSPGNATNKLVSWSSDNTSVATVDANGLVAAVSPGSAGITVTTQDGSKTAQSAITVTSAISVCTGDGPDAPGTSTPDYGWTLTNSANPTLTFIPGVPISGSSYVLIYPSVNGAAQGGYYMTQSGSNFTYTINAPLGASVSWYFTYQVPSGGERNSASTPDNATVGGCAGGNTPPTVNLTSPANGQIFYGFGSVSVSAGASDADGSVSKVEFFAGTTSLGVVTTPPYTVNWTPPATGTYALTAVATDNNQASTVSNGVSVTVKSAPVLTSVTVSPASASVNGGSSQQFTADGIDQYGNPIAFAPTWSISGTGNAIGTDGLLNAATAGTYTVTATQGNVSGSASVTINSVVGNCEVAGVNGDFSVQVTNTANPTITFIPGSPITGCTYVLIYPKVNGTSLGGYYMTASGSNFTYTVQAAAGSTLEWYFTYQVPAGGERNSLANPNTVTVGSCSTLKSGTISDGSADQSVGNTIEVFPVPFSNWLNVNFEADRFTKVRIVDMNGKMVMEQAISPQTATLKLNVSDLGKGVYYLQLTGDKYTQGRMIIK